MAVKAQPCRQAFASAARPAKGSACPSQGAEEIDDYGAELVAKAVHLLRGRAAATVTAGDCKLLTVELLADLSTVRIRPCHGQTMIREG